MDKVEMEPLNPSPVGNPKPERPGAQIVLEIGTDWRSEMFQILKNNKATKKDCVNAFKILDRNIANFHDLTSPDSESPNRNILYYVSNLDDNILAEEYVERIFATGDFYDYQLEDMDNFVNHIVPGGFSALHAAITKRHQNVALELLEMGADEYTSPPEQFEETIYLIYKTFPEIMTKYFDTGIEIKPGRIETFVKCDFSSITGMHDGDDSLRETGLLAYATGLNKAQRSEILLHPLVQIYLHKKGSWNCLEPFIIISMIYQVFWALLSAKFLVKHIPYYKNDATNQSYLTSLVEDHYPPPTGLSTIFYIVFGACYLISTVTEFIEWRNTNTENLCRGLLINYCQTYLLFVHFCALIFKLVLLHPHDAIWYNYLIAGLYMTGIFAAFLLVQAQATKIRSWGIYNQMLLQIFWSFFKFFITFCPILLLFMGILNDFLGHRPEFKLDWELNMPKIFAMMTGELNYDEIFHPEDVKDNPIHPVLTKFVFLMFIIAVVILLQNLLTGLVVDDVRKLREKYMTEYLTTRLEVICLAEHFLTSEFILTILGCLKIKDKLLTRILIGPTSTDQGYSSGRQYVKLSTLPKSLREKIKTNFIPEVDQQLIKAIKLALEEAQLEE